MAKGIALATLLTALLVPAVVFAIAPLALPGYELVNFNTGEVQMLGFAGGDVRATVGFYGTSAVPPTTTSTAPWELVPTVPAAPADLFLSGINACSFRDIVGQGFSNVSVAYGAFFHLYSDYLGAVIWTESNVFENIGTQYGMGNIFSFEAGSNPSSFTDNTLKNVGFSVDTVGATGLRFHPTCQPWRCHFDTLTFHVGADNTTCIDGGTAPFNGSVFTALSGEVHGAPTNLTFFWHDRGYVGTFYESTIVINGLLLLPQTSFTNTLGGTGDWLVTSDGNGASGSAWAKGQTRISTGSLVAGNANALSLVWQNPEWQDIYITKICVEVTTPGGTVGSQLDVGIADNSTGANRGTEFFDDLLLNTAALDDSTIAGDGGTQTKWVLCQDANSATDSYIIGQILTQNATNLVGKYYIEYTTR